MISIHEYYRKATHLFSLIIPLIYWYFIPNQTHASLLVLFFTILFIFIDIFRKRSTLINKLFKAFFYKMLRDHEIKGKYTGATWVMIAASITIIIFSKNIAILSLIFLSIGDTFAGLIGRKYGKIKMGNKTFEGFIAGLIPCIAVAYFYSPLPFYVSGIGAITAMLLETLPLPLDDNFRIPIGSALIMTILLGAY